MLRSLQEMSVLDSKSARATGSSSSLPQGSTCGETYPKVFRPTSLRGVLPPEVSELFSSARDTRRRAAEEAVMRREQERRERQMQQENAKAEELQEKLAEMGCVEQTI